MAAVEKVCEFSGEYPEIGWYMSDYKRNQIQILPKYRKLFRGASHTLFIYKPTIILKHKYGGISEYDPSEMVYYDPQFESEQEYIDEIIKNRRRCRFGKEYWYKLVVTDETLQGKVKGEYTNHTSNLKTAKRKLKRLLRCRRLNIVYLDFGLFDNIYGVNSNEN